MENELDRFETLLRQHAYEALSQEEKEWVKQFVASADEYESMRRTSQELEKHFASSPSTVPDVAVLTSLQKHFHLKKEESRIESRWSVPAWAAMLALVVAGGSGWYAGTRTGPREVYVERIVAKTDTLLVASRPDTVLVERVVYRNVPAMIPVSVSQPAPAKTPAAKGINMKEKEELEKLLVSGGL